MDTTKNEGLERNTFRILCHTPVNAWRYEKLELQCRWSLGALKGSGCCRSDLGLLDIQNWQMKRKRMTCWWWRVGEGTWTTIELWILRQVGECFEREIESHLKWWITWNYPPNWNHWPFQRSTQRTCRQNSCSPHVFLCFSRAKANINRPGNFNRRHDHGTGTASFLASGLQSRSCRILEVELNDDLTIFDMFCFGCRMKNVI